MSRFQQLAQHLPDHPRWVEVRELLLEEEGKLSGFDPQNLSSFVVRNEAEEVIYVVGEPSPDDIFKAVKKLSTEGTLITPSENANKVRHLLPTWTHERIFVYTSDFPYSLNQEVANNVRFLDGDTLKKVVLPSDLREELESAAEYSPIAATFVESVPVSFCYIASQTETLWDVSIDTLMDYRQRGYAGQSFAFMASHMKSLDKSPVWQSLESNEASWRLALQLGFMAVDELTIFYHP